MDEAALQCLEASQVQALADSPGTVEMTDGVNARFVDAGISEEDL